MDHLILNEKPFSLCLKEAVYMEGSGAVFQTLIFQAFHQNNQNQHFLNLPKISQILSKRGISHKINTFWTYPKFPKIPTKSYCQHISGFYQHKPVITSSYFAKFNTQCCQQIYANDFVLIKDNNVEVKII